MGQQGKHLRNLLVVGVARLSAESSVFRWTQCTKSVIKICGLFLLVLLLVQQPGMKL